MAYKLAKYRVKDEDKKVKNAAGGLVVAAFAGMSLLGASAGAEEIESNDNLQKYTLNDNDFAQRMTNNEDYILISTSSRGDANKDISSHKKNNTVPKNSTCNTTGFAADVSFDVPDNAPYSIVDGSATDYSFVLNDNGTNRYYKIQLNTNNFASDAFSWEEVGSAGENTIEVKIPHNGTIVTKYFRYTYTTPAGYSVVTDKVVDPTESISNTVFENISEGAIYVNDSAVNIDADFLNNGLAISNIVSGSIDGNFVENSGAISNAIDSVTYGSGSSSISGNYLANSSDFGGAILQGGSNSHIDGNFISNSATVSDGGAVYVSDGNYSIDGNFISILLYQTMPAVKVERYGRIMI